MIENVEELKNKYTRLLELMKSNSEKYNRINVMPHTDEERRITEICFKLNREFSPQSDNTVDNCFGYVYIRDLVCELETLVNTIFN